MMNWICSIPDHIGWMLVGAVGMLALEMLGLLVGTVVDMVRERMTNYEDEYEI
jgi:hypothetical protein